MKRISPLILLTAGSMLGAVVGLIMNNLFMGTITGMAIGSAIMAIDSKGSKIKKDDEVL